MPRTGRKVDETVSKKRTIITVIQAVIGLFVVLCGAWLVMKVLGYHQAQQVYSSIEAAYASEVGDSAIESPVDFKALQQEYPDVVAWLKMEDVDVSYPIVQGSDNEYFLHHDPTGQDNIDGSIFLDYRNKSLDTDLYALVYGHNMLDESMFGQLDNYVSEDFYQKGSGSFYIYTPAGAYRYKIFAVNVVDPSDDAYQVGFGNTQAFNAFVRQLKENSMYDTGVEVSGSDNVVTLSTCSDVNRLVLSAKRM